MQHFIGINYSEAVTHTTFDKVKQVSEVDAFKSSEKKKQHNSLYTTRNIKISLCILNWITQHKIFLPRNVTNLDVHIVRTLRFSEWYGAFFVLFFYLKFHKNCKYCCD